MKKPAMVLGMALMCGHGVAFAQEIATVDLVSVLGSGCKQDEFAVAIAEDRTAFTVSYSNYSALAGFGTGVLDHRKNCNLSVKVMVPGGFTYGIAEADVRGFADLQPSAEASAKTSIWFQGNPMTAFLSHDVRSSTAGDPGQRVNGRLIDNWQTTDTTPFASIVWAGCSGQRNLNINTELRISSPATADTSLVTTDATDGSLTTLFHLAFRPCP